MDYSIVNWIIALLFMVVFAVWWARPHLVSMYTRWRQKRRDKDADTVKKQLQEQQHKQQVANPERQGYDKLVIMHIEARKDKTFPGDRVLDLLEAANLEPGDMNMYQYFIEYRGLPRLVFNVINGIEPGNLDAEFRRSETPCITLFFALNESYNPRKSLDTMLNVAEGLARELDGQLQDSDRSVLTDQTKRHLNDIVELHILNTSTSLPV